MGKPRTEATFRKQVEALAAKLRAAKLQAAELAATPQSKEAARKKAHDKKMERQRVRRKHDADGKRMALQKKPVYKVNDWIRGARRTHDFLARRA